MADKKRRGRGEGAIYYVEHRKEWVGSVSLGIDPETGKRRRVTIYGSSKKDVQQRLAELRLNTASELARKRTPTFKEFAEGWLEREVKPDRRATTHRSYAGILKNHVFPVIGAQRINQLSPTHVQRCLSIIRTTSTASMAQKARTVIHRVMTRAVALELTSRNPAASVEVPRAQKRKIAFLTAEQLRLLFDAAKGDRLEGLAVLLTFGGMRLGEALALTWADVDFTAGIVRITKSAQESVGPIAIVELKTAAGRRSVTLGTTAMGALRRRLELAEPEDQHKKTDLIFPTTSGTPYRKSNLHRRWWAPLLIKANLPRVRIHDIRHSAASLSLLAGTDAKTISAKLGHESPAFTLRVYAHAVEALHRKDADALDSLLAAEDSQTSTPEEPGHADIGL